ncbi:MAG: DUF262 domain-containing protein [Bacteroidales bacterium]|nr:DUF262 domain-containing protein [Bacteroidales bacterium]
MEYNKLSTGEAYRLIDLFSKDNKIIIPDLQRDYCWGTAFDKDGKNLVERFIENITDNQGKELNLGLLYGYEAPLGHIQLCDGQQRITTLFLLLGMLNRKTNDIFRRLLISETEENDDWEPYLQYAIRESSLYFLSDLTRFFFIENKDIAVSDIRRQSWYFKDYDLDPSIQSMIAAMEKIETIINERSIDCATFGIYIIENLSFLYYDMENRTKGEETFVVINTTGEPLSATQNLKPLLIGRQAKDKQDECAQRWEQWEQFFWKNRGKNDTADNGLKEFFRWIMLLNLDAESNEFKQIQKDGTYKFDLENIEFDKIDNYFEIVSKRLFCEKDAVFPNNKDWLSPDIDGNSQVVWFRLLTVLKYINRFPNATVREIWRVRMFFRNLALVPNVTKAISEVLPEAIRIINEMPNADICSVLGIDNVSKSLLSEEAKTKLEIYRDSINRNEIEDAFWKEEEYKLWSGEILPMIEWATTGGRFDYNLFKTYRDKFNKIFHDNLEYKELDVTRRALLTRDLKDYPRKFKGYTNWSFAWNYEDWKALINDNVDKFKSFLDELDIKDIYAAQSQMIENNSSGKDFDEFVKIPELLKYCEQKKIQWWGDDLGWTLIKGDRASGEHANLKSYRLYLELKKIILLPDKDLRFYSYYNTCAVIDENKAHSGWAIDAWHKGDDKYSINLFRREGHTENTFGDLPSVFKLQWNRKRYEKTDMDKETIIDIIKKLIDIL